MIFVSKLSFVGEKVLNVGSAMSAEAGVMGWMLNRKTSATKNGKGIEVGKLQRTQH